MKLSTVFKRITKHGWNMDRALTVPCAGRLSVPVVINGTSYPSINAARKAFGAISMGGFYNRVRRIGQDIETALTKSRKPKIDRENTCKRCHYCGDLFSRPHGCSIGRWRAAKYCRRQCSRRAQCIPIPDDIAVVVRAEYNRLGLTHAARLLGINRPTLQRILRDEELHQLVVARLRRYLNANERRG